MKKSKSMLLTFLLSLVLCVNTFAGDSSGSSVFSLLDKLINTIESIFTGDDDDCETRICTTCRPGPNCRPR